MQATFQIGKSPTLRFARARGRIIGPAVNGVDYYAETFPAMARAARSSIETAVDDLGT